MSPAPASVSPFQPELGSAAMEPDLAAFARLYEEGVPQVVWTRLVADLETPVSAMLNPLMTFHWPLVLVSTVMLALGPPISV